MNNQRFMAIIAIAMVGRLLVSTPSQGYGARLQLLKPKPSMVVSLQPAEVIHWTNIMRKRYHQPMVAEDPLLDKAAQQKVKDMFARQYFAHVSPSGLSPDALVKSAGYKAVASGENLAYGTFKSEQDLIDAWMRSPGHRANILRPRFRDIGVAALKGTYRGHTVWMAVQEFGLSQSVCSPPDAALKNSIQEDQTNLNDLQSQMKRLQQRIEPLSGPVNDDMTATIRDYNQLVEHYNALVRSIDALEQRYNALVHRFNACVNNG